MKKIHRSLFFLLLASFLFINSCGNFQLPYYAGVSDDEKMTRFPVDFDKLFYDDDPTTLNTYLSSMTDGTMLISPFSRHRSGHHTEGYGKYYIRTIDRHLSVYTTVRSVLFKKNITGISETTTYGGNTIYIDTKVDFNVNEYYDYRYDHLDLLKSVYDQVNSSEQGYIVLPANTHVGYIMTASASTGVTGTMDFQVSDKRVNRGVAEDPSQFMNLWAPPYNYFNTSVKTELSSRWDTLYARMKTYGRAPEMSLTSGLDINIANSPWGVWYYSSGDLTDTSSGSEWYEHFLEIVSFIKHPDMTNSETFLYDLRDTTQEVSVPTDLAGLFGYRGNSGESPPANYDFLTNFYTWSIFLISGSATDGVFRIDKSTNLSSSKYMKTQLVEGVSSDKWDDQIKIEFFDSASAASGSFSSPLTYNRNP